MVAKETTKLFDPRITWGNLITIGVGAVSLVWAVSELKADARVQDNRIATIERELRVGDDDRKLLRDMAGDIKVLKSIVMKQNEK